MFASAGCYRPSASSGGVLRRNGMIFGFNTDVQRNGTTFHVQTEDRSPRNSVVDSVIYVRGLIVDRVRTPYDSQEKTADQIEALVRTQHREIVESLRSGKLSPQIPAAASAPSLHANGYAIRLLNPDDLADGDHLCFQLSISTRSLGTAATGSLLDARWTPTDGDTQVLTAQTHDDGSVDLTVPVPCGLRQGTLLVNVHGPEGTETAKFQISAL